MIFFFFNDTATTEIYTLSLHDALPISGGDDAVRRQGGLRLTGGARGGELAEPGLRLGLGDAAAGVDVEATAEAHLGALAEAVDRKSTRLNSSHANISYAVFCLKKKKQK